VTPPDGPPLANLRVLDLADASGAFAGRVLAALGADVVLVEPPGGHPMRRQPPLATGRDDGASLAFQFYHAGKRSLVADRATRAGDALVGRLADAAHVVVTTDAPVGARALAARHPRTVVASITPFGHDGPRSGWLATDTILQATGGLAYVNGHAAGPPLRTLGLQAHHQAGIFAAIGAVVEVLGGPAGSGPRLVDVSAHAAVAASLEHVAAAFLAEGVVARRQGTLHWNRAFRAGRCRDGWVLHSLMGDWTTLAAWVASELGDEGAVLLDPRWEDQRERYLHAEDLFEVLDRWVATRDARQVVDGAQLRRLPYAALGRPEALAWHPQLRARRFFADARLAGADAETPVPAAPFLLDGARLPVRGAPSLGAHGQEVEATWLAEPPWRPGRRRQAGTRPLAGTEVLDFTWVVAGPAATRTLADLGARVVTVEHPGTSLERDRRGGLTGTLMRGKESVVLDLRRAEGRRIARELAHGADVVADNFSARVMPQLGLDAATLRSERPDLVCLAMSGYGATGPWADRVSYGPTLQAEAGFTLLMAEPGGPPAGLGHSYADLASGHLAALAVLASLWRRARTGAGATIDFSQLEALAGLVGPTVAGGVAAGEPPAPLGNASQEGPMVPHGMYPAAGDDRWVAIAVRSDEEWRRLAHAMEQPLLASDERFATLDARRRVEPAIDALVAAWTGSRSPHDVVERLQRAGVPAGSVADARELLDDDPQLAARGHVAVLGTPEGRLVRLGGLPIRLPASPTGPRGPGPALGEHTRAVLVAQLGADAVTLAGLEAAGTIVQWRER
jgi:crotonobetainyl-CoA:carnitine CoA-transferase CaiB-like acyl-CoA transferase